MNHALLVSFIAAILSCHGAVAARELTQAAPSCATGSAYVVLKYDATKSFHAIMNLKTGVKSAEECASLCIADRARGCTCAFYTAANKMCQWRESACSTSEMYIDATPVAKASGLIALCPPKARVARWKQCGGKNYTGPRCCSDDDVCMLQNPYYAQCVPRGTARPKWIGTILRPSGC